MSCRGPAALLISERDCYHARIYHRQKDWRDIFLARSTETARIKNSKRQAAARRRASPGRTAMLDKPTLPHLGTAPFLTTKYPEVGTGPVSTEPYYVPDYFEREKAAIFRKVWLNVGRVEEIAEPGDYIVRDIIGASVLIVRQTDGSIRAFHNVCSHRSNKLVLDHAGKGARRFTCIFHSWSYDISGSVKSITDQGMFFNLDREACSLTPVNCDVWNGWIHINLDPNPAQTLTEWLGEFGRPPRRLPVSRIHFGCRLGRRGERQLEDRDGRQSGVVPRDWDARSVDRDDLSFTRQPVFALLACRAERSASHANDRIGWRRKRTYANDKACL